MIEKTDGIIKRAELIIKLVNDLEKCETHTMINYAKNEIKGTAKGIINYVNRQEVKENE